MAYMCVYASNHECDGCDECRQEPRYKPDPWDAPYDEDEDYLNYCEREESEK
jgi:hypothetical protein